MTDDKPEADINMELDLRAMCLQLAVKSALQPNQAVLLAQQFSDFVTDSGRLKPIMFASPKKKKKSAQVFQLVPNCDPFDEDDDDPAA